MKRHSCVLRSSLFGGGVSLRRIFCAAATGLFVLGTVSCEPESPENPTPEPEPEPEIPVYAITVETSIPKAAGIPIYEVEVPASAEADEEITVSVTPAADIAVRISGVQANGSECTAAEGTDSAPVYTFTMPEEDVAITVSHTSEVTIAESTLSKGTVVEKNEEGAFTLRNDAYFAPGETVYLRLIPVDYSYKIDVVILDNGTECEKVADEEYIYTFEMPSVPVSVIASTADNWLSITEEYDEHCEVIVLDNYYNETPDDYSAHYHKAMPGLLVHYYYTVEIGYDAELAIIGDNTGHDYFKDSGFVFQDDYTGTGSIIESWAFLMPTEPVTLKLVSSERSIYADEQFIGTYSNGLWINENLENHVFSTSESMLSADIRPNGVFQVNSTDSNKYDFSGTFTYDAAAKKFSYLPEGCKKYGLNGLILTDNYIFGTIKNILEDKPDNTHLYFLSRNAVKFVRATGNQREGKYFIETDAAGNKDWWLVDNQKYSIYPVEAKFSRGESLGDVSTAILTFDADPWVVKYTLDNAGGKPVVEYAGNERGTYSGDGEKLVLDGFGDATYGQTAGTYAIAGIEVTFTPAAGGEDLIFHINVNDKTYEKIETSAEWDGPLRFSTDFPGGKSAGLGGTPYVEVYLDHNFSGAEEKGTAKLVMRVGSASLADNGVTYTYNPNKNTITLSYYHAWYNNGNWVEDEALVLNVSADKQSLTFDKDYISTYGYRNSAYISGGDQTVLAAYSEPAPEPAGWDGPKVYSADKSGSEAAQVNGGSNAYYTVKMDSDENGNEAPGKAWITVTIDETIYCVNSAGSYSYDESARTLTVSGIAYGFYSGPQTVDFIFDVSADKQMITHRQKNTNSGYFFALENPGFGTNITIYADWKLPAAAGGTEPESGWDGPKVYSADKSGSEAAQVNGGSNAYYTVKMDSDENGNKAPGKAWITVTIDETIYCVNSAGSYSYDENAKTLTVSGIAYGYYSGPQTVDFIFDVSADKQMITHRQRNTSSGYFFALENPAFGTNITIYADWKLSGN